MDAKMNINKDELLKKIGKNIKHYREDKDISLKEMGVLLHLEAQTCGNIERGKAEITISRIFEYAQILNIPYQQLLEVEHHKVFNITNQNNENCVINTADTINNPSEIDKHIDAMTDTFKAVLHEVLHAKK
jgi:XRE family transcriptional regulator, regulator of sulfur utilization